MACARQPCSEHTVCPQETVNKLSVCVVVGDMAQHLPNCGHFTNCAKLDAALAQMRLNGQGLSHDQEQTIRRALCPNSVMP